MAWLDIVSRLWNLAVPNCSFVKFNFSYAKFSFGIIELNFIMVRFNSISTINVGYKIWLLTVLLSFQKKCCRFAGY